MTPITWHESPSKTRKEDAPSANPWFGIALALSGFIVGYVIAQFIR